MTVFSRLATALADRYHVERELGAGGMATVYLAHDLKHERDVAIKVLHPDLGAVLGGERFLAEIKTTAKLQHPHILPLLDSGVADGLLFYVMPFVEGETLRARLDRERQLPIADALQLAREVADGLQYAHDRGVIHRDIKPENVLLQGGHALVADFGIALAVQQSGGARMTQTGLSLGTPQYMAPEQAMGERAIDARADVYALGAVTYEMLTGEPPFTGPTSQAIVARVLTVPPAPLSQTRSTVPAHVEVAVLTALQKLPADRFATVAILSDALRGAMTGPTVTIPAGSPNVAVRRGVPPLLFGAVCMAAIGAALWGWRASRVPASPTVATRFMLALPDSLRLSTTGAQQVIAVAPSGSEFVFAAEGDRLSLYRRRLDSLELKRVPVNVGFGNPVYSPDGRWLALQDADGQLVQVPLGGGDPVLIDSSGSRPSWSDPDRVLYLREGRLWVRDGLDAPRAVELNGVSLKGVGLAFPFLLPGGRVGLVNLRRVGEDNPDEWEVAAVSLSDGTLTPLGVRGAQPRFVAPDLLLLARQNQTLVAVTFDPDRLAVSGTPLTVLDEVFVRNGGAGMYGLSGNGVLAYLTGDFLAEAVVVGRDRTTRFRLAASQGANRASQGLFNNRDGRLSPDGRRVVLVAERAFLNDLYIGTVATGELQPFSSRQRNLSTSPVWSSDGQSVLWTRVENGRNEVVRRRVDGTGGEEVVHRLEPGLRARSMETIPGRQEFLLAVYRDRSGIQSVTEPAKPNAAELWAITPGSTTPPRVLLRGQAVWQLRSSPDGKWVAAAFIEGGSSFVRILDLARPERSVVAFNAASAINGSLFSWLSDARTLLYRQGDQLVTATIAEDDRLEIVRRDTLGRTPTGAPAPGVLAQANALVTDVSRNGDLMLGTVRGDGATGNLLVVETHWIERVRQLMARMRDTNK
ncbi:serine/threonine-protein kinase [Gemmatimonas phototrophica]|uniref:serine/threonine-protein kinase n=1 Tax=Gemmatimonas phototrophica TaxID=1379270 RepID=UPI0006A6F0B6|nr:serine/threonine-protein kinase [Gemmatimonas phototrophica]